MSIYRVAASGLPEVEISCSGCSGDALTLALAEEGLQSFRVDRRSADGLQWCFQATFKPGALQPPDAGTITRMVTVERISN